MKGNLRLTKFGAIISLLLLYFTAILRYAELAILFITGKIPFQDLIVLGVALYCIAIVISSVIIAFFVWAYQECLPSGFSGGKTITAIALQVGILWLPMITLVIFLELKKIYHEYYNYIR